MMFGLLVLATAIAVWLVVIHNRLVRLRNQVSNAWADIDVQLTRRHDLVPMLVAAVKGYAGHERSLLESVAQLRTQAQATQGPAALGDVEAQLEQGLGRIFALREAYPDLQASANFIQLQRDLVEVEGHLQYARRFYNGAVRDLNDGVQKVPDVIVARLFGFAPAEFFQAQAHERAATSVALS